MIKDSKLYPYYSFKNDELKRGAFRDDLVAAVDLFEENHILELRDVLVDMVNSIDMYMRE